MAIFIKLMLAVISVVLISTSCTDRDSTSYATVFTNNSGHALMITPYAWGAAITEEVVILNPGEQKEVCSNNERGISSGGLCYSCVVRADSFVVNFDGLYTMSHYNLNITQVHPRAYSFTSPRNIANEDNYELRIEDPKRHHRELRYSYAFTVQDYVDASN